MTFNTQRASLIAESVVGAHYPNQPQSQWMSALRPALASLRSSYYTNDKVRVDYASKEIVHAYTLGYAVYHAWQTYEMLEDMTPAQQQAILKKDRLSMVCICGGPGFEVLGLLEFLRNHNSLPTVLNVTVVDKNAHAWKQHANLVQHLDSYGVDIRWTNINTTFTSPILQKMKRHLQSNAAQQTIQTMVLQAMRRADLVTAQNCLNEISLAGDEVVDLLGTMKPSAIFAGSDLSGYRPNGRKMRDLCDQLRSTHIVPDAFRCVDFSGFRYSAAIETHFFKRENGLWPRRRLNTIGFVTQRQSVSSTVRSHHFLG